MPCSPLKDKRRSGGTWMAPSSSGLKNNLSKKPADKVFACTYFMLISYFDYYSMALKMFLLNVGCFPS
jgi:hypothetical protein